MLGRLNSLIKTNENKKEKRQKLKNSRMKNECHKKKKGRK
jgi:hypothetical protein